MKFEAFVLFMYLTACIAKAHQGVTKNIKYQVRRKQETESNIPIDWLYMLLEHLAVCLSFQITPIWNLYKNIICNPQFDRSMHLLPQNSHKVWFILQTFFLVAASSFFIPAEKSSHTFELFESLLNLIYVLQTVTLKN